MGRRYLPVTVQPDSSSTLPSPVQRVVDALRERGVDFELRRLGASTRTAREAAAAVGCEVGRIVKSLVFVAGDEPVVVLASGAHRVDLGRLEAVLGVPARPASPAQAEAATGFPVGAIPPVGHARPLRVVMDEALLAYPQVWAAAGTAQALFAADPRELRRATRARVAAIGGGG
ncbi:YbaK/EbsC family protein [Geochorda subterranea]|uniref:YbaK/EbsC family protein n=1 Tax=Geochorda subterranea TaxID=3109564 RepID=A0ABZ1BN99_9FIRM|nr:YbaK/EbsC family protein [Limnochorda sp. LNt]WRP14267.1 YbaK/EbsC family protein [Limnochorda sp. LNt]